MALETPIASFQFATGPERGTQLQLFGTRLLHQGLGQMESIALASIAAVGAAYARDYRRIAGGVALLLLALLLFAVAGALSGAAAEAAAEVSGNHSVARLIRGTLYVLGVLAALLPAVGVAALLGGGALIAFGWIGTTTLLLTLPAGARAYPVRGQDRMLVDFTELVAERVAQSGR
jgi:hypothetical protein